MSFSLPNFLHAGFLNALRAEMGAPLSDNFKVSRQYKFIELPIAQQLLDNGVEVEFHDITVLNDTTLSFKGYRVLLYIRDIPSYGDHQSLPKYHLAYCRTLETMRARKRFDRYVVANRENGLFPVNVMGENRPPQSVRLGVCQNCLALLQWKGFASEMSQAERQQRVDDFQLREFFERYPRDLLTVKPRHTADDAPINDYTDDWGDVSERVKLQRGYVCEKCHIRLDRRQVKYLHVHHRDGVKYNNADSNLEVLCIGCHANEPMHGHMRRLPEYQEFIALYAPS